MKMFILAMVVAQVDYYQNKAEEEAPVEAQVVESVQAEWGPDGGTFVVVE